MNQGITRRARYVAASLAVAVVTACGGNTAPPPQPGQMRGSPPNLTGRRVILLPVQRVSDVVGDIDAELAFTLRDRGREIEWIGEDDVEEVLARSPGANVRTRGLPVGDFLVAEVRRIGDPLYGQLRRMAALVDAEAVLIPIAATFEPNQLVVNAQPRVRLTMTLIEPRSGRVVWFGVEEGGDFPRQDPRALASAVERVARTLFGHVGG